MEQTETTNPIKFMPPVEVYPIPKSHLTYEIARFDSMANVVDEFHKGYDSGWDDKGYGYSKKKGFQFLQPEEQNDWRFGSAKTWRETERLLQEGTPTTTILRKFEELREETMSMASVQEMFRYATTKKRHRIYREEGAELCVDRVMCGDPQHWHRMTPGKKKNVVTIGIDICTNADGTEHDFAKLACFGSIAADLFTTVGYSTSVNCLAVTTHGTSGTAQHALEIAMKRADENLDTMRLLTVGLPGVLRCIEFIGCCNLFSGRPASGLGSALGVHAQMQEHLQTDIIITSAWLRGKQELHLKQAFETVTGYTL